jgi:hypothetical protein
MPKPQIDGIYQVYANRLNTQLANAGDKNPKIPVRVLSGTRWIMPKAGTSIQPHQAVSARKFRVLDYDRSMSFPEGLLVCWVQEPGKPGETGLRAATGPDAVRRLRALQRPDLARYRDFLHGPAREHNLQIDVVNAPDLTDLITEEPEPMTETSTSPTFVAYSAPKPTHFLVAPVSTEGGDILADLGESKVSASITGAVDRMQAGLRAGEVFAAWEFTKRPNPAEADESARYRRPDRLFVHVGGGQLMTLADEYRIALEVKED